MAQKQILSFLGKQSIVVPISTQVFLIDYKNLAPFLSCQSKDPIYEDDTSNGRYYRPLPSWW